MLEGQFSPGTPIHLEGELPPRNPWQGSSLLQAITRQNLLTNLRLCLDAGDSASLPAASTKWLDTSGNGYDFFRGTSGSSESTDPTINGTPNGRSANEFLSFDGGDYLSYDTTNETWMQNIHKSGARFTFFTWAMFSGFSATQGLFGDSISTGSNTGFRWSVTTTSLQLVITNAGAEPLNKGSVHSIPASTWRCLALSVDTVANTFLTMDHGNYNSSTATYTSPSTGSATSQCCIGSRGSGELPLLNGGRMAEFAAWEGRALTQSEIDNLFSASRRRFGT
jgi:hypothetical protein